MDACDTTTQWQTHEINCFYCTTHGADRPPGKALWNIQQLHNCKTELRGKEGSQSRLETSGGEITGAFLSYQKQKKIHFKKSHSQHELTCWCRSGSEGSKQANEPPGWMRRKLEFISGSFCAFICRDTVGCVIHFYRCAAPKTAWKSHTVSPTGERFSSKGPQTIVCLF